MNPRRFYAIVFPLVLFATTGLHGQAERWIFGLNSRGGIVDEAYDIVSDDGANLYAAGEVAEGDTSIYVGSRFTVAGVDTAGRERWVYQYDHPGTRLDSGYAITRGADGNLYAAGTVFHGSGYDFTVISVDTVGRERWVYTHAGPFGWEMAKAIVWGGDGRVYAAGYGQGTGNRHMRVACLDPDGTEIWRFIYNRPDDPNWWDEAGAIAYGDDGNLYVAGYSGGDTFGSQRRMDFAVVSVDRDGGQRWAYLYDGPAGQQDQARSVLYGSDGRIYAAGFSRNALAKGDIFTVCLAPDGTERWTYRYEDPAGRDAQAYDVIQGTDGNLYVAGYSDGESDITVISLDPEGRQRWVYRHHGTIDLGGKTAEILAGRDGFLYVAGYSGFHATVVALDRDGTEQWVYRHTSGGAPELATSIVDGIGGNLYVAGWINDETGEDTFGVLGLATGAVGISGGPTGGLPAPSSPSLSNAPNPFNPSTTISFTVPGGDATRTSVALMVYDLRGRCVRRLIDGEKAPGSYRVQWDGRDDRGRSAPSGVYLCRLASGAGRFTRKMTLVR